MPIAQALAAEEGVPVELAGGETATWQLPAGVYVLASHGGASVDVSGFVGVNFGGHANRSFGDGDIRVELATPANETLRVLTGSVSFLLARPELQSHGVSSRERVLTNTSGTLSAGTCQAFHVNAVDFDSESFRATDRIYVVAHMPAGHIAILDRTFTRFEESYGWLLAPLNPLKGESYVQVCATGGTAATYAVDVAFIPPEQPGAPPNRVPAGDMAVFLLGAVMLAAFLRRNSRP